MQINPKQGDEMGIYLYGYILGFASGVFALRWWQLGNKKVKDGNVIIIHGCDVAVSRKLKGILTIHVSHIDGSKSCFYHPAEILTIAKLEKIVKRHLKVVKKHEAIKKTNG